MTRYLGLDFRTPANRKRPASRIGLGLRRKPWAPGKARWSPHLVRTLALLVIGRFIPSAGGRVVCDPSKEKP